MAAVGDGGVDAEGSLVLLAPKGDAVPMLIGRPETRELPRDDCVGVAVAGTAGWRFPWMGRTLHLHQG